MKLGVRFSGVLVALTALTLAVMAGCKQDGTAGGPKTGKVNVVATTPDIGVIAKAVGGELVEVTTFVKPGDDPHVVEANTSMVEALVKAELLAAVGQHVEDAWLPGMVKTSRNAALVPNGEGYLSLAKTARLIAEADEEEKTKEVSDKAPAKGKAQSFHPEENPHFLLDPVEGVRAGKVISQKLAKLRPDSAPVLEKQYKEFAKAVMVAQLGPGLAEKLSAEDFEPLSVAIEKGELKKYLSDKKITGVELAGAQGELMAHKGTLLVGDHDLWPYFARRYGVEMVGYIEGHPGEMPNAQHLSELMALIKAKKVPALLRASYFDAKQTQFIANQTGVKVVEMAHFPGSRTGTQSYPEFIQYNARQLSEALKTAKP